MNKFKAVIVAAGESSRLQPLSKDFPKCFLKVGKYPLIEYSLKSLKNCGVEEIAFVVGYKREYFTEHFGDNYRYIFNPFYATTNNMVSLWFAKDFVKDSNFLYLHSDILYHPEILAMTIANDSEITLAVEETDCDEEMMKVRVEGNNLIESSKSIPLDEAFGEWVGIAKFKSTGWEKYMVKIEELLYEGYFNAYDTSAMNRLVEKEKIIRIVPFKDLPFVEVDSPEDLKRARDEVITELDFVM
jgi:L-glutamine-phosphate cytidylyltransferase